MLIKNGKTELSKYNLLGFFILLRKEKTMTKKEKNVKEKEVIEEKKAPVAPKPTTHTVAEGETLAEIATRYQLSLKRLYRINDISGPVEIGTKLTVEG